MIFIEKKVIPKASFQINNLSDEIFLLEQLYLNHSVSSRVFLKFIPGFTSFALESLFNTT